MFTVHCEHRATRSSGGYNIETWKKIPQKVNFTLISGGREFKYHLIMTHCKESYSKTILTGWMMNPHLRNHFVIVWKCSVLFSLSLTHSSYALSHGFFSRCTFFSFSTISSMLSSPLWHTLFSIWVSQSQNSLFLSLKIVQAFRRSAISCRRWDT